MKALPSVLESSRANIGSSRLFYRRVIGKIIVFIVRLERDG